MKRKQSRKRLIIQQPSNGGQECPEVLEEEKDCEVPKICPGFRYNCSDATFYSMDRYMMRLHCISLTTSYCVLLGEAV